MSTMMLHDVLHDYVRDNVDDRCRRQRLTIMLTTTLTITMKMTLTTLLACWWQRRRREDVKDIDNSEDAYDDNDVIDDVQADVVNPVDDVDNDDDDIYSANVEESTSVTRVLTTDKMTTLARYTYHQLSDLNRYSSPPWFRHPPVTTRTSCSTIAIIST